MSHDLNFSSSTGEVIPHYLKVNGCMNALSKIITDEETFHSFYNRSLSVELNKDQLLKLIEGVINLDWKHDEIPEWIQDQLKGLTELANTFDFTNKTLTISTL